MASIITIDCASYENRKIIQNSMEIFMEEEQYHKNLITKNGISQKTVLKMNKKLYAGHYSAEITTKCQIAAPVSSPLVPAIINNNYTPITPIVTVPTIPVNMPTPNPIFVTPASPFTAFQPIPPTFVQTEIVNNMTCNYTYEHNYGTQAVDITNEAVNTQIYNLYEQNYSHTEDSHTKTVVTEIDPSSEETSEDNLDSYLRLPKNLFPTARKLAIDPNPIIDELCKIQNIEKHTPWLLDLEFGIPKFAITRSVPMYNVKFNSIHCKNTPDAIHPGFESCNEDFKKVLLFYYDCVVSLWYIGYVVLHGDRSVENFQSWLLLPMAVLGMCWP